MNTPEWYVSTDDQITRARNLWPNVNLPKPPTAFTPRTSTEVPLLHVPDKIEGLWDKVVAPQGYKKDIFNASIRLAPNIPNRTQPVWLGFDPECDKLKDPRLLMSRNDVASSELLSVVIQFRNWPLTWQSPGLHCPGRYLAYQLEFYGNWDRTLGLMRVDDRRLLMLGVGVYKADDNWTWSIVRELGSR